MTVFRESFESVWNAQHEVYRRTLVTVMESVELGIFRNTTSSGLLYAKASSVAAEDVMDGFTSAT